MDILRTACAGVLLELDGMRLLLDGVGREVKPYPATPPALRQQLLSAPPDALLITHQHPDHYDDTFVSWLQENTACPILGPSDIPHTTGGPLQVGNVMIQPVESRHIGRPTPAEHRSYILQGSQCVWFLGDASPLIWKKAPPLPQPDVLIAPYAYGMGGGWEITKSLGASAVVLLHLPQQDADRYGLWDAVKSAVALQDKPAVYIPQLGQRIHLVL